MANDESKKEMSTPKRILNRILQYVVSYFVGILAALIFTPADLSLIGRPLWYLYPLFAIPAFFFLFTRLTFHSVIDFFFSFVYLVSVACIIFGFASHFGSLRRYLHIGPKLIGFSFGFMGTAGVYFFAAESI